MKNLTFFGGAQKIIDSVEYIDSIKVGEYFSKLGYHIKCGGYGGLMEAVSKGANEAGGTVTGYVCESFGWTKGNEYLTETVVAKDIYDRLRHLIEGSDVLIIQKGGIGTITEAFLTLDLVRKMKKNRPKVIFMGAVWRSIMEAASQVMSDKERDAYVIVDSFDELEQSSGLL